MCNKGHIEHLMTLHECLNLTLLLYDVSLFFYKCIYVSNAQPRLSDVSQKLFLYLF